MLCVQNTFLHFTDVDIEARRLSRSKSDSSLSTPKSGSDFGDAAHYHTKKLSSHGAEHIIFPSSDASGASCSGGSYAEKAIPEVAALRTPVLQASKKSDAAAPSEGKATGVGEQHAYWSMGAELHAFGKCRPCAWFWQPEGCDNGRSCQYCHMCAEDALVAATKLRKKQRRQAKAIERQRTSEQRNDKPMTSEKRNEHVDENTGMPGSYAVSLAAPSQQWAQRAPIPRNRIFSL